MKLNATGFRDLLVLEPRILGDARGYFMESYNRKTFLDAGIDITFVQDNQSSSRKGVLRGLHFQRPPHLQTKLIRVLSGTILDVVIDLRSGEPTYGKHFSVELSSENNVQLLVPKGFAHGFIVLSEMAEVLYKCDEYYHPGSDGGIHYQSVDVDWRIAADALILSEKDRNLQHLQQAKIQF